MSSKNAISVESGARTHNPWLIRPSIAYTCVGVSTIFVVCFACFALPHLLDNSRSSSQRESPMAKTIQPASEGVLEQFRRTSRRVEDLKRSGDFAKAFEVQVQLVADVESKYGPENVNTAIQRMNLAWLHQELGRFSEAEALLLECRDVLWRVVGPNHRYVVICVENLADLHSVMEKPGY